jgi:hypothetical protein
MPGQKGDAMDRIAQRAVGAAERALRDAELWRPWRLLGGQYPTSSSPPSALDRRERLVLPLGDDPTPELAELLAGCRSAHEQATEIRLGRWPTSPRTPIRIAGPTGDRLQRSPDARSGTVCSTTRARSRVRGIAILDEWDQLAQPAMDEVVRNPDGSIASAWIGWAADVPSVGYRTFHLVPESVIPQHDEPAPTVRPNRPSPCATEPPSAVSLELGSSSADSPLRVQLASRQTGHLPASFSLLNLQPAGSASIARMSLTADDAIRILLRELGGQHCRVELRLFVPFPDDVQAIEPAPRQLVTVTGGPNHPHGPARARP